MHWVSAAHAVPRRGAALRSAVLGRGSRERAPEGKTFLDYLNPRSLEVLTRRQVEPSLAAAAPGTRVPVRAPRLLLRRPGQRPRATRLQPHRLAARHLGEDRAEAGIGFATVEYHITQYDLEQGALEIQYIEEFFGEFPRKKTAAEIVRRLDGRAHLILLATAPLPDDPGTVVPVSFKVAHEIQRAEDRTQAGGSRPSPRASTCSSTAVACSTRGSAARAATGAARDSSARSPSSRSSGRSNRASTRSSSRPRTGSTTCAGRWITCASRSCSTSATRADNAESKVYLSKKLLPEMIRTHRSAKTVVQMPV